MDNTVQEVLDLYGCQGGAAYGYQLAGFRVTGVDRDPQPRYIGEEFHQSDAVTYVLEHLEEIRRRYALIHASPPCQFDSDTQRIMQNDHQDLIGPTRRVLELTGLPYVMENVRGAEDKLRNPVMICGLMVGIPNYRHRFFETGGWTMQQPDHPPHTVRQTKLGRFVPADEYGQWIGNFNGVDRARREFGVPWMSRDGIRECIPPAYSLLVARQFLSR